VTNTSVAAESVGVFTRDQVEILSARKVEADWLREARQQAYGVFAETPMPTTQAEEWRYTDIGRMLRLDALSFADEAAPAASVDALRPRCARWWASRRARAARAQCRWTRPWCCASCRPGWRRRAWCSRRWRARPPSTPSWCGATWGAP
jgi:hypothetical protein